MLPECIGEFRCAFDPDLRFSPNGTAVCSVRAVASSRKQNTEGVWEDDKTVWVKLIGFKRTAENMAESFEKGDLVVVTGKLQTDEWTDKDNQKRTTVEIVVRTIGHSVAFNPARSIKTERATQTRETTPASDPATDPWAVPAGTDESAPPF